MSVLHIEDQDRWWAARDLDGSLWIYTECPRRATDEWVIPDGLDFDGIKIDPTLLPNLSWEDNPRRVRIDVKWVNLFDEGED